MQDLRSFRKKITSQDGEDGIIDEIFSRLGTETGWCVEFGAWDGVKLSNTWNLWSNKGWSAVLIEGDPKRFEELKRNVAEFSNITPLNVFVDSEGEDSLDRVLGRTSAPQDFELLSIDVDGWDYHIWKGLQDYHPKLVVIEYNATFPPHMDFVGPKESRRFGASALALSKLAQQKDYRLICCTRTNMFFVRSDVVGELRVAQPSLEKAFRYDHITYVVSTQHGNAFLTRDLPFVGTRSIKGMAGQTLPTVVPASPELRTVVIIELGWLRRVFPPLVPLARLARALWHLWRRRSLSSSKN